MIPMIDLLVCCISFLLITAVWSHMARINADAQVPGPPNDQPLEENKVPDKTLHVEMRTDDKFTLTWKQGTTVVSSLDVPRPTVAGRESGGCPKDPIRYSDLGKKIEEEWKANGSHRADDDKKVDQAVLHTDNKTPFCDLIAVIDAIYAPKRPFPGAKDKVPALNVTFSVN